MAAMQTWLEKVLGGVPESCVPASSDASFRRYFRATANGRDYIVMDAPPAHEDCRPFVNVAGLFREAGVHVPEVIAEAADQGFLLLSDLGPTTYLDALDDHTAHALYLDSNAALIRIQLASRPGVLPVYDSVLLARELALFPDWYIERHLDISLDAAQRSVLDTVFERLLANALAQPQVYVHRDWHSRNLMVSRPNPGVLDFQDAVYGPITYDLVSLYRDAYITWDEERQLDWVIRYWEAARAAGLQVRADFGEFWRDYEWMGAQRQLKVLGIFARLKHRDGKDGYLKDMPRVMAYLRQTCERYDALKPLAYLLDALEARAPRVGYTF
jgi:aminoglycoside/choline kinase family phosphotransferase